MSDTELIQWKDPETATERGTRELFAPRADIFEHDESYELFAEMPGVDAESVDVSLEGRALIVRGRSHMLVPGGLEPLRGEYRDCDYERTFSIGDGIDGEGITADIHDGVLHLRLPKADRSKARKIPVSAP